MKIKQKNTIDMTHGTLWNKLLIFALPLAASSIIAHDIQHDRAIFGFGFFCGYRSGRPFCKQPCIGGRGKQQFAHRTDD